MTPSRQHDGIAALIRHRFPDLAHAGTARLEIRAYRLGAVHTELGRSA